MSEITIKKAEIGTEFTAKNGFRFIIYDLAEANKKPERKAIIKNYFYERSITLIYGQAGHGKTWWSLFEAVSLAGGKKLLDLEIEKDDQGKEIRRKILYITLEMEAKDIVQRIDQLTAGMTHTEKELINKQLRIVSFEDNAGMIAGNAGFISALGDLVKRGKYDIVYIDSFAEYIAGFDQRNEDHMRKIISQLRGFTVEFGVSFRVLHHGTKTYADGSGGSMAGIHTIRDLVDHVYNVKQTDREELRITSDQLVDPSAKARYKRSLTLWLGIQTDGETYYSYYRKDDDERSGTLTMIANIKTAVSDNQGITAGELKDKVHGLDTRIRDQLIGTDLIMIDEKTGRGGHAKKHYFTVDYYNDHREEIEQRYNGDATGTQQGQTVVNTNGNNGDNG